MIPPIPYWDYVRYDMVVTNWLKYLLSNLEYLFGVIRTIFNQLATRSIISCGPIHLGLQLVLE